MALTPSLSWGNETVHALAMHGEPAYDAQAKHLNYANPNAPKTGHLRQAVTGSFDTLNPHNMKGKPAAGLHLTTDRLMQRVWDEPFSLYSMIAKEVIVPDDRSAITFILDPKAEFHDGHPITAEDVVFSLETLRDKGKPNARRVYKHVEKTSSDNDHHVMFTLGEGHDRETIMILAMMPVLPKHYWQERDFSATILEPPLGSGPYKISDIDPGRAITYTLHDAYWAADKLTRVGHHNFTKMTYDYYRDEGVAVEAFLSGAADIRRESDPIRLDTAYDKHTIKPFAHQRPLWMKGFILNLRRAPLDDPLVREALISSFDFSWVNKTLMAGKATQVNGLFTGSALSANHPIPGNALSVRERLRKADDLLTQAGWTIKQGQRQNAQGSALSLSLILNNAEEEKIALYWSQTLKRLGITLTIRTLDTAQFVGALNEYDYDLISHRWINSLSPGTEQMLYWSCEAANQPGNRNYSGVCTDTIDRLALAVANASDRQQLDSAAINLDTAVMQENILIPLGGLSHDYFIVKTPIATPDRTPIYGPIIETWWSGKHSDQVSNH